MKSTKLSFDFKDASELVELLRVEAAKRGVTQKALVVEALRAYFADKFANKLLRTLSLNGIAKKTKSTIPYELLS